MVKDYLEKKEISLKEAFFFSCHKFDSLLGVCLLVGLIIFPIRMGWLSFLGLCPTIIITAGGIVECLIGVLFCYSASVIIMDNVGAWKGIKKSMGVAKRNYFVTFLILLIPVIPRTATTEVSWGVRLDSLGVYLEGAIGYILLLILSVIYLFIVTWVKIIIPYIYYNLRLSDTFNIQSA
jgi:hypothetical protein